MTEIVRENTAVPPTAEDQTHKMSLLELCVHDGAKSVFGEGTATNEITRYLPHALSTAALFMPGRKAVAVAMGLGILNEVKSGTDTSTMFADAALGATKAGLTKVAFEKLGPIKSLGGVEMNAATKGILLGGASRVIDDAFTRENYFKDGKFDFTAGLQHTASNAFNGRAIAMDAVLFGSAHAVTGGLNKITGGAIERSAALNTLATGWSFGTMSGGSAELTKQMQENGGNVDWLEVAKRAALQGLVDTAAAGPAARHYSFLQNRSVEAPRSDAIPRSKSLMKGLSVLSDPSDPTVGWAAARAEHLGTTNRVTQQLDDFKAKVSALDDPHASIDALNRAMTDGHYYLKDNRSVQFQRAVREWAATQSPNVQGLVEHALGRGHGEALVNNLWLDSVRHESRETLDEIGVQDLFSMPSALRERADMHKLSPEQVRQTMENIVELLSDGNDPRLVGEEFKQVSTLFKKAAFQAGLQAANPDLIIQAQHPTCALAALEVATYIRHPEVATRIVKEVVQTGKFTLSDGTVVRIDPRSLSAEFGSNVYDMGGKYSESADGMRSYASQVFQLAAANAHWQTMTTNPDGRPVRRGSLRVELQPDRSTGFEHAKTVVVDRSNPLRPKFWDADGYYPHEIDNIASLLDPAIEYNRVPEAALASEAKFRNFLARQQFPENFPLLVDVDARWLFDHLEPGYDIKAHAVTITAAMNAAGRQARPDFIWLKNTWRGKNDMISIPKMYEMLFGRPGYTHGPSADDIP